MASRARPRARPPRHRAILSEIASAFARHNLLTYAAAIAFQGLIALVPLTLLALGMLGATGHEQIWTDRIAPAVEARLAPAMFTGIDDTVRRILDHASAGLIAVSVVLSTWYLAAAMRAVIEALDAIHDVEDERSWPRRIATTAGLGVAAGGGLFGAALLVLGGPRGVVLGLARWAGGLLLIALVVGVLLRFAPAQRPQTRWASIGAAGIVGSWVVASTLFRLWITYVANFKTPIGTLTTLLVLTSYLYVSASVFLAGAQLDELLRKRRAT